MKIGLQLSNNPQKFLQFVEIIRQQSNCGNNVEFIHITDDVSLEEHIVTLDISVCYKPSDAIVQNGENLKWIHIGAAGVEEFMIPELLKSRTILTNSRGINATPVAEFVFAQMLYFSKQFPRFEQFKNTRKWEQWDIAKRMQLLSGKTVGLLGYGAIGKEIAKRAKAFNMNVIALRRLQKNIGKSRIVDKILPQNELDFLLKNSDFIVVSLPQTQQTEHFLSTSEFAKMQNSAILINISRGKILDEIALIDALQNNQIAGVALDVFATEPLDGTSPLFDLPNVLLSPHVAGNFPGYQEAVAHSFADELGRYLNDKPFKNRVCKKNQY